MVQVEMRHQQEVHLCIAFVRGESGKDVTGRRLSGRLLRVDVIKVGQAAHAAVRRVNPAVKHHHLPRASTYIRLCKE